MVRTRFAPSPTGFLHVGGLRTALFSYVYARKHGGQFLLRIEDTDRERFVEGGVENIIASLHWAGLTIDEGVDIGKDGHVMHKGDYGPYIQSERLDIYKEHIQILLAKGDAYYCFCSKERLDALRKDQEARKMPTGYDGHCRNLSQEEIDLGKPHVIRMKMPKEGKTCVTDIIRGEVCFDNSLIDDQVLIKTDGFPTYHFALIVDDHLMKITHVIRGEEWISSTPKHIELYRMFGWEPPAFAHLPLLVNEKKQKLSKRHGDVSVRDFTDAGYMPEALVNFVAFLGWNPGDERELFTLKELEKAFSLEQASKAAAVFNREKLDWYNKQYMMLIDLEELAARALPFFVDQGVVSLKELEADAATMKRQVAKAVALEQGRAATLRELVDASGYLFADALIYDAVLLVWKKSTAENTKNILTQLEAFLSDIQEGEWVQESLENQVKPWIEKQGYGTGDVLWPMRVALSGQKNSPGPHEIAEVLGREKTIQRLEQAIGKL